MKRFLSTTALCSTLVLVTPSVFAGDLTGRVSDKSGTISLDGARVKILETGVSTTTDRAGRYRFYDLPAGTYTLQVSYIGADPFEMSVTVGSDSDDTVYDVEIGSDVDVVENILVVGQIGSLNSALNRQRASDRLVTVLSADAIGQLPDENVAEAARRAAGVNVLNDQGEGRFISIRGASPAFVSATINGVRVTSPEAEGRQVPLDVIDSDILSSITVTKTLTPDVDADNIGGNVEISTLSGRDQNDMVLRFRAAGIYAEQVEEVSQRLSGVFANNYLDGNLGVAASLAWQQRRFGSENIEVDGPEWIFDEGVPYPGELEFRDYQITRERLSASLNLDYAATDELEFYVRGLYSEFSDQEFRSRVENKFGDPSFLSNSGTTTLVDAGDDDPYEVDRDIKDRLEQQTIFSVVTGFDYISEKVEFDMSASYSYADEVEPDRLDTDFRTELDSGIFGVDVANPILPSLTFGDAASEAAYFDPNNFEFNGVERTNGVSEDEEFAIAANLKYKFMAGNTPISVKTGGKLRLREKFFDFNLDVFDGFDGGDFNLSNVAQPIDFDLAPINPVPNGQDMREFFTANLSSFEFNEFDTAVASNEADYDADEDIYAGYVMFESQLSSVFSIIGGVRIEHTEFSSRGQVLLQQEFETELDGDQTGLDPFSLIPESGVPGTLLVDDLEFEFDADDGVTALEYAAVIRQDAEFQRDYTDFLPSVLARFDVTDEMTIRAGYHRSLARPDIEAASPRVIAEQGEDGLVAEAGNPNLNRQRADNFDLSFEYYPDNKAVYSVSVFHKEISDFIARQQLNNVNFNGNVYDELDTFVNLDDASLTGVEVNVQQPLTMLPGFLNGFIVNANYTYVDGQATLANGRDISIPGQSQNVITGILGYEKGPINLRLAATYRDEFLDEISVAEDENGNPLDRIVDDHLQLDFTGRYFFTEQAQLYVELKNLTDEPFVASINSPGFGRLNAQFEEYGITAKIGFAFIY